jgi:hypothetical protein
VLFSHIISAPANNQPAVFFSHNKSAPATSQPNEVIYFCLAKPQKCRRAADLLPAICLSLLQSGGSEVGLGLVWQNFGSHYTFKSKKH